MRANVSEAHLYAKIAVAAPASTHPFYTTWHEAVAIPRRLLPKHLPDSGKTCKTAPFVHGHRREATPLLIPRPAV